MIKSNKENFITKSIKIHGDLYDYSNFEYNGARINGIIICRIHGDFLQRPDTHLSGHGCSKCGNVANGEKCKSNKANFIKKANIIHCNTYDYSEFVYITSKTKGAIICGLHGVFYQIPNSHLRGNGCHICANIKTANILKSNKIEFIKKANLVHCNTYDYSEFEYNNARQKNIIKCKTHGIFRQSANDHLQGKGCKKCGAIANRERFKSTKAEFIEKANLVHCNTYDYFEFDYIDSATKGKIICKKHGTFLQTPGNHINGKQGCPICTNRISKLETKWLDSLNVPLRQYSIQTTKRKINVDGYDPDTNTVYQFHGDYWHGNPKRFPDPFTWNKRTKCFMYELYENTTINDKLIEDSGYNLIVKWESDI